MNVFAYITWALIMIGYLWILRLLFVSARYKEGLRKTCLALVDEVQTRLRVEAESRMKDAVIERQDVRLETMRAEEINSLRSQIEALQLQMQRPHQPGSYLDESYLEGAAVVADMPIQRAPVYPPILWDFDVGDPLEPKYRFPFPSEPNPAPRPSWLMRLIFPGWWK